VLRSKGGSLTMEVSDTGGKGEPENFSPPNPGPSVPLALGSNYK